MTQTTPVDSDVALTDGALTDGALSMDLIKSTDGDSEWLALARSNFEASRQYQDASLTVQWERNADHFNNRHFRRSVYNTRQFRGRSRLFRPLTRTAERASSAQFAAAMFSNMQILDVQPGNQNDPMQVAAARIMKSIVQYRLEKTIPWYLTCLGVWQDTRVYGPCCTYTTWDYAEREIEVEEPIKDVLGKEIEGRTKTVKKTVVVRDEPAIKMIPVENLLLDPECDWRDPVQSSPYAIVLWPMHLDDVLAKMDEEDPKTKQPAWRKLEQGQILSARSDSYNTVRQSREGDNRPDKTDSQQRSEYKVVWVHENFVRVRGEEYVYWTLGTEYMLTDPTPLRDVYFTGKRPLTYGFSIIEAHRFSPSSPTELISGLQEATNDVSNLRLDNVRLALNKRYILRRGAEIDLEALMLSVPGGAVMTDDIEKDIKVITTNDVTASSYKEQERLETESNGLTGSFMGSSVQNNRALNQTVGGMEMLAEGADAISEFDIRTFSESWMKPQLELLVQYIQAYETDDVIFNNAFEEAFKSLGYKYNLNEEVEEAEDQQLNLNAESGMSKGLKKELRNKVLNDKLTIIINVGLGATSPQRKMEMITTAVRSVAEFPGMVERIDGDEIVKEIFAAAGFQDGSRFIKGMGPGEEEQKITEEEVQRAYEKGVEEGTDKAKMAIAEVTREVGLTKIQSEREIRLAEVAAKQNISMAQLETKTGIEVFKDKTRRDIEASKSKNFRNELEFKRITGKPGV